MLPLHKLRNYSDKRLLNVVIYREQYGYPFDYVEAAKEELRRRGYTNVDLQRAVEGMHTGDLPERFAMNRRIATAGKLLIFFLLCAALLFIALFILGGTWSEQARKAVGGLAVLCLCFFFLVYAGRTILRGRLARLDDSSDNSSLSP